MYSGVHKGRPDRHVPIRPTLVYATWHVPTFYFHTFPAHLRSIDTSYCLPISSRLQGISVVCYIIDIGPCYGYIHVQASECTRINFRIQKLHVDEVPTELVSVLPVPGNSEVEFSFVQKNSRALPTKICGRIVPSSCAYHNTVLCGRHCGRAQLASCRSIDIAVMEL